MHTKTTERRKSRITFLIIAVMLIAAVVSEFAYSRIAGHGGREQYPQLSFSADDFASVEFASTELPGENRFVAAANDAHFTLENLGGAAAESIDILMTREAGDATETVIYFTGESRGVYSTFVAGLKEVAPGRYRATARFDALDKIEVYPTEVAGAEIIFEGAEFNTVVETLRFSVFRIPLWFFLFAAVFVAVVLVRSLLKRQKPRNLWLPVYILVGAAVALFAAVAADMYATAKLLGAVLIPLLLAAYTVFYLFIYVVAVKVKAQHIKVFLLFLFAGAIFAVGTAPLQVPDESIHYARGYAVAMGSFSFDGDFAYPDDVEWMYDLFSGQLAKSVQDSGAADARTRLVAYFNECGAPFESERAVFSNAMLILPYLPSALGVAIVRLFGGNAVFALWAGRLMNVLMVALAAAFAAKKAVYYKTPLLVMTFFPLTLFMAASFSYDAMLLAAMLLFFGIFASEKIGTRDFILMAVAFAAIAMIKPLYLLLGPLLLLLPKERFALKLNKYWLFAILIASGVLLWQLSLLYADLFSSGVQPAPQLPRVDKAAQLQFILKNPLSFAATALVDGFRKNFYLGEFGLFGHLDLLAPLTTLFVPAAVVAASALSAKERRFEQKRTGLWFLLMIAALYFAVSAAFYIESSVPGSSTILGIQARYFTPSLFFATALCGGLFSRVLRPVAGRAKNDNATLWLLFSVGLVAALEVFAGYYL